MLRHHLIVLILLMAVSRCAIAAPQPWIELHTGHFILYTDVSEKDARKLGDQFERMRWMFKTLFPEAEVDPVEPLFVVAVKSRKEFQSIEPADYLAQGTLNLAGLFANSTDRDYILLRRDVDFDHPFASVFHEYTHLLFRNTAEWMPVWLKEGLAEFMQNTDFRQKDVILGDPSVDNILFLRQKQLIPLTTLLRVDRNSPYYHEENKGSIFYAESWVLTHYLMITGKQTGKDLVGDYTTRLSRHEDSVKAAQESFGDLKTLEGNLREYIQRSVYMHFIFPSAAAPIDESQFTARTLTPVEIDALRADVLAHVGRGDEATALAETILKTDGNIASPHETLAYVAFRKGDHATAVAQYTEAVHLNSNNFFAFYMAASEYFVDGNAEVDEQIESELRDAIRLNPRFIFPYFKLATILMAHSQLDEAQMVLNQAQPQAHTGQERLSLRSSLDQLERMRNVQMAAPIGPPEPASSKTTSNVVDIVPAPRHPDEPETGPHHTIQGEIHAVECSYPAVLDLQVESGQKNLNLYSSNYFKLQISAANFTPEGQLHPCSDLNGVKAKVVYAESSDKTVDGQVISIELRK